MNALMSRSRQYILLSGAVALPILILSASLANQPVTDREASLFRMIFDIPTSWLEIFKFFTYAGTLGTFFALIILAIKKRNWLRLSFVVPGIALAYGATYFIKEQLVSRARPPELFGITPRDDLDTIARDGFPSGHVAVAALLTMLLISLIPQKKWRYGLLIIPILVGIGRIYVGEHMPLDVLGGLCIGITINALFESLVCMYEKLAHRNKA